MFDTDSRPARQRAAAIARSLFTQLTGGLDIDVAAAQRPAVEVHVIGLAFDVRDSGVPGAYVVEIDKSVPAYQFASVALEELHATVPIFRREDFSYKVISDGVQLPEDPHFVPLAEDGTQAFLIGKVGE